ncbi:MAG: hypothetical protein GX372_03105 [Ignavibacteria bacterium]|jgi:outer membrane protein assembly factor BamA|nr:hypothetical protein [Ignavibacteria bacterium]
MKHIIFFIFIITPIFSFANDITNINSITIDRKKVFEKEDKDWFFGAPLFNSVHFLTKEYIIEDEILFAINDTISEDSFLETERNLRATGLFTEVKIELEENSENNYDVFVITKDRWSFYPSILFGIIGEDMNYGGRLQEFNLFGTGTYINMSGIFREELDIGLEGLFELRNQRIFRSELALDVSILANQYITRQDVKIHKDYRTLATTNSYGISANNNFGKEFFLNDIFLKYLFPDLKFLPINEKTIKTWYSRAWKMNDFVYLTGLLEYNKTDRGLNFFQRAYDNQGKILVGFSSSAQNFYAVERINSYNIEDLEEGGWGTAILGKTFPIASYGGERGFFYVAGQAEKSVYTKDFYLFGQLTGASSFSSDFAKYTYQSFLGLGFVRLNEKLLLAAKFDQQAVWNWPRFRQLVIDETRGLRGYSAGELAGDNRLTTNIELRYFPDWQVFIFKLSGALFYDIASVWNQTIEIFDSKFYSSIGAGLRLHFTKSDNPLHTFRIDFPYNFHTKKVGISLGVSQYFEAFGKHRFRLPEIYGTEFDFE